MGTPLQEVLSLVWDSVAVPHRLSQFPWWEYLWYLFKLRLFGSERSKSLSNLQQERYIFILNIHVTGTGKPIPRELGCHVRDQLLLDSVWWAHDLCFPWWALHSPLPSGTFPVSLSLWFVHPAPKLPCDLSVSALPGLGVTSPPYPFEFLTLAWHIFSPEATSWLTL